MCADKHHSRAPDAAQRPFDGALQSRGPCISGCEANWVPALRSSARTLQAVRDTLASPSHIRHGL